MGIENILPCNMLIDLMTTYHISDMSLLDIIIAILVIINEILIYTIIKILVYDNCAQRHQDRNIRKG